jgi:hypothetical protein
MNSPEFSDPQLQSLEAQLAAAVPQLDENEQQRMLYACAYAAGAQLAHRSVKRWQAASGLLSVLLLGVIVPVVNDQLIARRESPNPPAAELPVVPQVVHPLPLPEPELAISMRPKSTLKLDAWQVPDPPREYLPHRLTQSLSDSQSNTWRAGQLWRVELF